jgi:DNA-binding CsgD family transcriptional regulator/tetratricopeptide (TPR) repeat protein
MTVDPGQPHRIAGPLLVGREREQGVLREHLEGALDGRGGLILVGGEAGIGKTTLVDLLASTARDQGALVLTGGCYDLATTPAYGPWLELASQYPLDPAGPQLPAVLRGGEALGAVASQAALFEEVRAFFATLAAVHPTLLVLEDLHWADAASLELLRLIARHARRLPLLLVVTYRSDEVAPDHPLYPLLPLLVREAGAERLDLRRLADADVRELVDRRYQLAQRDADRLVPYLLAHAEGNPLYLSELLRTLEEEQVLRASPGEWVLGDLGGLVVPRLIRQVIAGRAARFNEATRQLLTIAAVIGQEVSLDIWSSVSGASDDDLLVAIEQAVAANFVAVAGNGMAVHFVHALIREALYEGILPLRRRVWHRSIAEALEQAARPSPDAVAYHFQAAGDARAAAWLIRAGEGAERAYAWTTAAARFEAALPLLEADPATQRLRGWVLLHLGRLLRFATPERSVDYLDEARRVADVVGDRSLAALALVNVGMVRIFRWDVQRGMTEVRAGIAAQDTLTPAEWAEAYRRQRVLIDPLPADLDLDDPRGLEIATITSQQTGWLVHQLAHVAVPSQDVIALGEAYAARIDALDAYALLRHTSTVEGASWIDTYHGLGEAYAVAGQVDAAERAFSRAVELYQAAGHHAVVIQLVMTHGWLVQLPYQADDHAARARWLATGEASQLREEGAYSVGWSPGMRRLPTLVLEGDWSAALEVARNMTQHQPAPYIMLAEVIQATIAHAQGDTQTAWGIIQRRFPNGPASDIAATFALHAFDLARLAAALSLDGGDRTSAERWLAAHDRWLNAIGRVSGRAESRVLWARSQVLAGAWSQAQEAAEVALGLASTPRQPLALLATHRLLGEIATHEGCPEQAEQHLAAALDLAEACGAPFERARTLLALGELRAASGRTDEAQQFAEEARLICTSLGAVPTLERVTTLIARLEPVPRVAAYPAGLTAREVDVLRLVAQGLTDAEVAERLFLARRTVNTHLTSIYTKLGVNTRAAATRFAVEHELT